METVLSIGLGIGLSAASGFRVFVPLLVMSIASLSGHLALAHGFQWIGTYPALIAFGVATCMEVAGYYVPLVGHFLDILATPSAVVAGIIITASVITDMSPLMKWALAIIAGGGVAGIVQGSTVLARGASTATTGGLGNVVVATLELAGAIVVSILALAAPFVVVGLLVALVVLIGVKWLRRKPKSLSGCGAN
ncbi:MAG: DUF4126 domain-containing protein [Verrucomicrobiota bacterium]|jgi:hypothetical protein